jgi:Na+/H+-dicarboxylate symporter
MIRGDVTLVAATIGGVPTGANLGTIGVTTAGYFTGATPVPATVGLGIVTVLSSAAGTPADPTAGVVVTYDIELSDI